MKQIVWFSLSCLWATSAFAQHQEGNEKPAFDPGQIKGNVQVSFQNYQEDSTIGAVGSALPEEKASLNAFTNLNYTRGSFSAGIRYESYLPAQVGYPDRFTGTGLGYRYASYELEQVGVTVGNFYEQFGNGLVLRTYEERALGIDNALDGIRVKFKPFEGVYLKGIYGKQRFQFADGLVNGDGLVRGIDGEIVINELSDSMANWKTQISIGANFVSKYQVGNNPSLVLPENVGAYSGRINLSRGNFSMLGEYAYKINDPSADNNYIYKDGHAALVNLTYATKGFSVSLDAKTTDNFSFRSNRDAELTDLQINFSPALTKQHSYNLAATLYPYGSRPQGEVAYQAEVAYKIPKKSKIGGKYGTLITANFSTVYGLDSTNLTGNLDAVKNNRVGYENNFFTPGDEKYFHDFNVEIRRKFNKKFSAAYTYLNFFYNNDINQGAFDNGKSVSGDILAQIHILDLTYKITRKHSVRTELQHLSSDQHLGNWATAVVEYSYSPNWFVGLIDQYNYGNKKVKDRIHYLYATIGYVKDAHRFTVGYGKQRAGLFCVGGVCRTVPASNGLTFTFSTSF